jgi:multidrug efflux pump subunit AcrB
LPGLSVSYNWPDASARVIEQEVTSRLEGLFSGVKGVKEVLSISSKGFGRINLSIKKTVNLDAARLERSSLISNIPFFPELFIKASGQNNNTTL